MEMMVKVILKLNLLSLYKNYGKVLPKIRSEDEELILISQNVKSQRWTRLSWGDNLSKVASVITRIANEETLAQTGQSHQGELVKRAAGEQSWIAEKAKVNHQGKITFRSEHTNSATNIPYSNDHISST